MLATAYGAIICNRHLAGVAGLLTAPYVDAHVGEIVGLYTITRFKGEGIGDRLIEALLNEADRRGLEAVFATTIDDRAAQFFERMGFTRVRTPTSRGEVGGLRRAPAEPRCRSSGASSAPERGAHDGKRMEAWLRVLGIVVLALGVGLGAYAATRAIGDTGSRRCRATSGIRSTRSSRPSTTRPRCATTASSRARSAGSLGGLVFGSLLLGIASVLARTEDSAPGPRAQKRKSRVGLSPPGFASRVEDQGRLKRVCIFIARPMSPEILSLPLMKAIWPLSLPVIMST